MALNIKDEAAHRDARRLALLTGQSMTTAVREAIALRLQAVERERKSGSSEERAKALLEAAKACKATMRLGGDSADHADLYGDDGLPA